MYLFTVVQYVGMAALLASFAAWNYKRGLKKGAFTAMILIFALVPIFPFYALSLWKDTVFGIVIFLYSWFLFCLCERINASYVNDNPGKFLGTYANICLKNPVKAVKGYLLATTGFWDMFEDTGNAFKCTESISWTGVYQEDWFSYKTGVEFRSLVEPRRPVPAAIRVWITIMLAVPLAFSFRYIFAVFLCLPIYWLCGVCGIKDNRVQE